MPKPEIDYSKCTGCYTCVEICPMDVFEKTEGDRKVAVTKNDCIGCRACEVQCPVEAIKVKE